VALEVFRAGETLTIEATLGGRAGAGMPDIRVVPLDPNDPDFEDLLKQLPPELRERFELPAPEGSGTDDA
jgi:hypothetical protein